MTRTLRRLTGQPQSRPRVIQPSPSAGTGQPAHLVVDATVVDATAASAPPPPVGAPADDTSAAIQPKDGLMWPPDAPPNSVQVPARLAWAVRKHLYLNALAATQGVRAPLILGIHGRPGEGKTLGCQTVLNQLGIDPFTIGSGQLEAKDAGVPAARIRERYLEASHSVATRLSKAAVVFINDIDTALGDWGQRYQYTVNTQTAVAELMHLCDLPQEVEGRPTQRVPIVITGNDFTRLYAPLLRLGRMRLLEWKLTLAERAAVVGRCFPWLPPAAWGQLARRYALQPLSLFDQILLEFRDRQLYDLEQTVGVMQLLEELHARRHRLPPPRPALAEVVQVADALVAAAPAGHLPHPQEVG